MHPQDIANVCLENNDYRFKAIVRWIESFPDYLNINTRVQCKVAGPGNFTQTTCLIVASEFSNSYFVKELMRVGASVEALDLNLESPLHKAAKSKIEPIQKTLILLAHKPSLVNLRNKSGFSPLHYAVLNTNLELTKLLLEQSLTEVNVNSRKLLTPLHVAAHFGIEQIVSILLQHGDIEVNATDHNGDTAAHHSAYYDHLEVYSVLRMHQKYNPTVRNLKGLTVEEELFKKLLNACRTGSEKRVIELVEEWNVPLQMSRTVTTALHASCKSTIDSFQKVRFLIVKQSGLITQRLPASGSQAVHLAAQNEDSRVLNEFADHFVTDINSKTLTQMTPLHITCSLGYTEHVNLLLQKALVDVNIADHKGNTPLHVACLKGHLQIIHALNSHPMCRSNIKNKDSKTPDELTPYHTRVLELAKTGFLHELDRCRKET